MKVSMTEQEKDDILIEVTTWEGWAVYKVCKSDDLKT